MRITVAHVTTVHRPFDTRIFHRECVSLARAGYDVVLVAPHVRYEVVNGVRIKPVPIAQSRLRRRTFIVWAALREAVEERALVYHLHDPELVVAGALLKAFGRARIVYDMHEFHSEILASAARTSALRWGKRVLWSWAIERVPTALFDATVFPTETLRKQLQWATRGEVLMNLPSRGECKDPKDMVPWERREYDVVFTGTISPPRMRVCLAILEALAKNRPSVRWLFIGTPQRTVEWVRSHYGSDFILRHIKFVPPVPHDRVLGYLDNARVGFNYHPPELRFRVAIPTKVLEYAARGLPVVTTALPELVRLLRPGEAVLVDSDDALSYAKEIEALLRSPDRAQQIGIRGQAAVRERLNWEVSEEPKLLGLYSRLVGAGNGD